MLRRFVDRVSSFDALSAGAVAAASVLLAFAVAGPVVELAGLPGRLIVFAVVMALQISRRVPRGPLRGRLLALATLPVVAVVTALLGELMRHDRGAADVLVVAATAGSFATRRAPPAIARVGRLLSVPVVVLFVTPVPGGVRGGEIGWYLLLSLVAGACVLGADRRLGGAAAERAVRAAIRRFPRQARAAAGSAARFRRSAVELDTEIAARAPDEDAAPLRLALLEAELAATEAAADLDGALARLARTAASTPLGGGGTAPQDAGPGESRLRPGPTTRVVVHAAVAMALALAISQRLYPDRWSWTVVSVLAISGGLRSRGDVLLRSGERLLGALAGTFVATLLADAVGGNRAVSIVVILALIAAGSVLREVTYASWAFCVTSALALLYGLYGERGSHLLGERLVQNVIGAACVIVPSYFLLPVRTEAVVRRRVASVLSALDDLLATLAEGAPAVQLTESTRAVDRRRAALEDAVRPAAVQGRVLRAFRREPPRAVRLAAAVGATDDAARPLVYGALTEGTRPSRATLGALRRSLGSTRRALGGRRSEAPPPLPDASGDGAQLDRALRGLHDALTL